MDHVALISMHSSPLALPGVASAGGMNLYVRHLADGLATRGLKVDVFTRRTNQSDPEVMLLPSGARVVNLTSGAERPLPKGALIGHVPAFADAIRKYAATHAIQYDVLHSHYWLSGLAALRASKSDDIPLVHMFHTLSKVKELYFGAPDPNDTFLRLEGERTIIEEADAIVGATSDEARLMQRLYGYSPALYAVLPPGVDSTHFRPVDGQACRHELGITAERVILFVGRVDRIKGLDTLLHSVATCARSIPRSLQLLIVGGAVDTQTGEIPRLRHLARTMGIEPIVQFVGSVHPERLPVYYNAADITAIPSAYESFGMAATESMACGTPVVAFGVGGLAATIIDGQTGFLAKPGITTNFTAKLQMALNSDDLDAMGRRARASILQYSWDSIVDKTLDLYQRASIAAAAPCRWARCEG